MASIINASTSSGVVITPDNSGVVAIQSNGSNAIVTSGANVTVAGTLATTSRGISTASVPVGSVIQVVSSAYSTEATTGSSSWSDTGLTATITPLYSTSKILCLVNSGETGCNINKSGIGLQLLRGASSLAIFSYYGNYNDTSGSVFYGGYCSLSYLDSPATTSATTYKVQFRSDTATSQVRIQAGSTTSTITLLEIAQ